ncbi:MAG: hypothetical protein MN733_22075, partial [Nitrososphaera sp.]|nr:hypothetical protein [Nitrososphaera sp.]
GINNPQNNDGIEVACTIANDLLLLMQGQTPPADKSVYPRADLGHRRRRALLDRRKTQPGAP